jgi:hypothetical protein
MSDVDAGTACTLFNRKSAADGDPPQRAQRTQRNFLNSVPLCPSVSSVVKGIAQ